MGRKKSVSLLPAPPKKPKQKKPKRHYLMDNKDHANTRTFCVQKSCTG